MIDRPALEAAVRDAEPPELFALAGELQGRTFAAAVAGREKASVEFAILDADEAARVCGVTKKWLLQATKGMSFRRDLGHRTKRFEKAGLLRWLRTVGP